MTKSGIEDEYLQVIIELAQDIIVSVDEHREIQIFNHAAEKALGYTREELDHAGIEVLYANHDEFLAVGESMRANGYFIGEITSRRKNGETFPSRVTARVLHDKSGKVIGSVGYSRDLTEERAAAAAREELAIATLTAQKLEEKAELLGSYVKNSPDALVTADKTGIITDINPGFEQLLGFSRKQVIGKPIDEILIPDQYKEKHNNGFTHHVNNFHQLPPVNIKMVVSCMDVNRQELELDMSLFSIIYNDEPHYIASLYDNKDRKNIRQMLIQSRELAEKESRAKSEFLANMSHEIRSPMNIVLGMSHLLGKTELDATQQNYISKVAVASEALIKIINDILDFSKIEANKLDLELQPFKLSETMRNHQTLVEFKAQEKGLTFSVSIDEDVPNFLIGDALRLGQILNNLVFNAIKFTEKGLVSVQVSRYDGAAKDADKVTLKFKIQDSGIGVSKAQQKILFNPFQQADNSTTRRYGGTGLGLAICKQLSKLMGGEIGIESDPGTGSIFWFSAQFQQQAQQAGFLDAEDEQDLEHKIEAQLKTIQGAKVLIVDDIQGNQELLSILLEEVDIQSEVAENGLKAVEAVKQSDGGFDAVFMDLQMPEMDGIEATRHIRKLPGCKNLPIIAVTADAMVSDRQRCEAAGMVDHLPKPIDTQKFYQCLLKWIPARENRKRFTKKTKVSKAKQLKTDKKDLKQPANDNYQLVILSDQKRSLKKLETALQADFSTQSNFSLELDKKLIDKNTNLLLIDIHKLSDPLKTLLEQIKTDNNTKDLPLLILSADTAAETEIECLQAGIDDYIVHPFNEKVLPFRIKNLIEKRRNLKANAESIMLDNLTGLANRQYFEEQLYMFWRQSTRNQSPLSVILVKIDKFKDYKHLHDRKQVEECIKSIGQVVQSQLSRAFDLVCHYSEHTFACLLPDTHVQGANWLASSCQETAEALRIPHKMAKISDYVTVSVGGCTMVPSKDIFPEQLLVECLYALADAEERRTDRIEIISLEFFGSTTHRIKIESKTPVLEEESLSKETLAGIDKDAALKRIGGKERVFRSLLSGFKRDFADASDQMLHYLFKKLDFESAQRLAHSVKGMAGNISAKNLFESAYELDMSIRSRQEKEWRLKFENFKNNLAEVINSITDYIDKNDIEKQSQKTIPFKPRVLDAESAKPLMKQLLDELRSSSLNTETTFASLQPFLTAISIEVNEEMENLEEAIEQLDYKEAEKYLFTISAMLDISLE